MMRRVSGMQGRWAVSTLSCTVMVLVLLQGPLLGLVMCFEDNGQIAVETPHERASQTTLPSHAPCLDRPLLSAGRLESSSVSQIHSPATMCTSLAAPSACPPLLDAHRLVTVSLLAYLASSPPLPSRTTILLI